VATSEGCLVIFVAPPGGGYHRAAQLAKAAREAGAHVLALVQEGDAEIRTVANTTITLPPMPEFLTPIVYLVPLQLLTYWLALELGRNPDVFRWDDPRHLAATRPIEF
jgi:glucosamine--fructose-6-phosphate aminotransferase (isomerizing)